MSNSSNLSRKKMKISKNKLVGVRDFQITLDILDISFVLAVTIKIMPRQTL